MAQTIKRTVDIQYQAKGLDEIRKQLSETSLFSGDSEVLKNLKREIEEYSAAFAGQEGGMTDPAMAKEMSKKYASILKLFEKYRLELLKAVDFESASAVDGLNEEIEATEKLIANKQKIIDLVKDRYVVEETGQLKAKTQAVQKETLEEAAKVVGAPKEKMIGIKGREIKTPVTITKNGEEVLAILDKISNKNTEINKKLRNGEKLTRDQKVELDKILEVAKAKGEVDKDFKNSAKEINDLTIYKNQLEAEQKKIIEERVNLTLGRAEAEVDNLQTDLAAKIKVRDEINNQKISLEDLSEAEKERYGISNQMYKKGAELNAEHTKEIEKRKKAEKEATKEIKQSTDATNEQGGAFTKAAKQVFNYGVAFNLLRRIYRETIQTITELDKALTEMTIVTTMSREEAWNLIPTMEKLAKETGFTTTQVAELTTEYLKQGRTLRDSITLAEAAAKAARIAGISAAESVSYLTAAINGFSLAADDAMMVSDKFAALAASSATDYEELATGLSKFAAQANVAGISIDFALGMLAKGVETTREAPETIGTALKTVIARMRELTDLGKTLEDGMDVNRVEKALGQVGIQLRDTNGQFRDMQAVLTEVGQSWAKFDTNQRASIAVSLAGTRQQSRLIAIMNDFDRTLELVETSQESAGATAAQHIEYMKGMDAAMARLRTSWQQFITTITNSEMIIGIIRGISSVISVVSDALGKVGFSGQVAMTSILAAAAALKVYTIYTKIAAATDGVYFAIKKAFNIETLKSAFNFIKESAAKALSAMSNILLANTSVIATGATWSLTAAVKALINTLTLGLAEAITLVVVGLTALISAMVAIGAKQNSEGKGGFFVDLFKLLKGLIDSVIGVVKSLISVIKSLGDIFLIVGLVFFGKFVVIAVAAVAAVKTIISVLSWFFRILAIGAEWLSHFAEKLGIFNWMSKAIGKAFNAFGKFFKDVDKGLSKWEQKNRDLMKSYEELSEEIDKTNQKALAENYELGQKNKEIEKFVKEYQDLNSKEIKTEEDLQELENLKQGISEINKEFLNFDGSLNESKINEEIEKNQKEIVKNLQDSARNTVRLIKKDIDSFLKEQNHVDVIGALMTSNLEQDSELTDEQKKALGSYYDNLILQFGDRLASSNTEEGTEKIFEEMTARAKNYADVLLKLENSFNEFDLNGDSIASKVNLFNSELSKLTGQDAQALKELFPELVFLTEKFGNKINNVKFQNMFAEMDLDAESFDKISKALESSGISIEDFMSKVADRQAYLVAEEGLSSALAFSQAWAEQASGISDLESRVVLYGIAAAESTRDVANQVDYLNSKLSRVKETQDKFMKGELTDTELLEFLGDYGDLIGEEGLQKFMQGGNLGRAIRDELRETQEGYKQTLSTYRQELKNLTGDELAAQKVKILQLEALIQYSNELSRVTEKQYAFNSAQERYNRLKEIGADNDQITLELLEAQIALAEETINNAQEEIADLNNELMENLGKNYADYFEIINGVLVWNYEKLKTDGKEVSQELREQYQAALDVSHTFYKDLMKQSLDREKKIADEKKKVYEEYFDALDRIQEKRERKRTREDLVAQLQRLEGATDEKSRQRAKEIRQELNEMDRESSKLSMEENRKAILESIDRAYEEFEEKWGEVYLGMINAGLMAGNQFINALVDAGLLGEEYRVEDNTKNPTDAPAYSQGGIVSHTGIAQVHGTPTKPEAFLNADQTEMFAKLRDYLSSVEFGNESNSSVVVENITIQTQQLNNKQDFDAAGRVLADAFGKAIGRRGISVNAKR